MRFKTSHEELQSESPEGVSYWEFDVWEFGGRESRHLALEIVKGRSQSKPFI
jgi:hypothetical protein